MLELPHNRPIDRTAEGSALREMVTDPVVPVTFLGEMLTASRAPSDPGLASGAAAAILALRGVGHGPGEGPSIPVNRMQAGMLLHAVYQHMENVIKLTALAMAAACPCGSSEDARDNREHDDDDGIDGGCTPWGYLRMFADQMEQANRELLGTYDPDTPLAEEDPIPFEVARALLVNDYVAINLDREHRDQAAAAGTDTDLDAPGELRLPDDW